MPEYFKSAGYTTHAIGKVRTEVQYWSTQNTEELYFSGTSATVTRTTLQPSGKPRPRNLDDLIHLILKSLEVLTLSMASTWALEITTDTKMSTILATISDSMKTYCEVSKNYKGDV